MTCGDLAELRAALDAAKGAARRQREAAAEASVALAAERLMAERTAMAARCEVEAAETRCASLRSQLQQELAAGLSSQSSAAGPQLAEVTGELAEERRLVAALRAEAAAARCEQVSFPSLVEGSVDALGRAELAAIRASAEDLRSEGRCLAATVARARELGQAGARSLEAAKSQSLRATVEAREVECAKLHRGNALAHAEFRLEEARLEHLREEIVVAERRASAPCPTISNRQFSEASEALQLQEAEQASAAHLEAAVEVRERLQRSEREVSRLLGAHEFAQTLVAADPRLAPEKLSQLRKALPRLRGDAEALRSAGSEAVRRAEAMQLKARAAEMERQVREFSHRLASAHRETAERMAEDRRRVTEQINAALLDIERQVAAQEESAAEDALAAARNPWPGVGALSDWMATR